MSYNMEGCALPNLRQQCERQNPVGEDQRSALRVPLEIQILDENFS